MEKKEVYKADSMIFYKSWHDHLSGIEDEGRRLRAYEAVFRYAFRGEEPADARTAFAVELILYRVRRDMEKYLNGRGGGPRRLGEVIDEHYPLLAGRAKGGGK